MLVFGDVDVAGFGQLVELASIIRRVTSQSSRMISSESCVKAIAIDLMYR